MKNSLDRLINRSELAKEIISKHKKRSIETVQSEEQKLKMKKNERRLRDLWDTILLTNMGAMGVPGEER